MLQQALVEKHGMGDTNVLRNKGGQFFQQDQKLEPENKEFLIRNYQYM